MNYAVRLGADCAFFIKNKAMLATGIGEQLTEIDLSLKDKFILLAYPSIHVSTKEAFANIIPHKPDMNISRVLREKFLFSLHY